MSGPSTIPEALFASAGRDAGEYVFHLDGAPAPLSSAELAERAQRAARRLVARGVRPGDAVGVLGPNQPEWVVSAFAVWIAGAAVVPVQIPIRVRDPNAFRERLRMLVAAANCRCVLVDPQLAALLPPDLAVPWDERGGETAEEPTGPSAHSPAVIQFTSGSTAAPKGALLSHEAVLAQMDVLQRACRHEDGTPRTVLSWTPYFHDLGLFANVVHPAVAGASTHHFPTMRFARDPAEWLRLIEMTRVTMTVGPCSAFGSAVRAGERSGERIDLSSLEVAFFAAEGVDPEVVRRMTESAQRFAFPPEALGATYGLAEAVLAVSYPRPGDGLRIDRVSLERLASEGVAVPASGEPCSAIASCGSPLMDVRIAGEDGVLPERHVGEIQVRGPSLMSRYVGPTAPDPFVDGWLCTGDLGYLAGGELHVTGRAKDMMIAMGHNYYPEDFEWAAARVDGVRPGRCVAFNLPGTEKVIVLAEAQKGQAATSLEREVRREIVSAVGVPPARVLILPADTVQKTTSGKLQRAAMRELYANGVLEAAV